MNHLDDAELDRALSELAQEDRARALPERVRGLVIAAWDERVTRDVPRATSGRWIRAGAVAAVLCAAAAISLRTNSSDTSGTPPRTSSMPPAGSPSAVDAPAAGATMRQPAEHVVTRPRTSASTAATAPARRRAAASPVEPREVADVEAPLPPAVARLQTGERTATTTDLTAPITDDAPFVAIVPGFEAQPLGWFQVARVQVPRRVLVDAGVLATEVGGFDLAQADVLFGEDGRARAIRLISTTRRTR